MNIRKALAASGGRIDLERRAILAFDPVRRLAPAGPVVRDVAAIGSMTAG